LGRGRLLRVGLLWWLARLRRGQLSLVAHACSPSSGWVAVGAVGAAGAAVVVDAGATDAAGVTGAGGAADGPGGAPTPTAWCSRSRDRALAPHALQKLAPTSSGISHCGQKVCDSGGTGAPAAWPWAASSAASSSAM
jgi:hypothetical protein